MTSNPGTMVADGRTYQFDYLFDRQQRVVETTVKEPDGKVKTFKF